MDAMKRTYSLDETIRALRQLLAADISLKSSGADDTQLLVATVTAICKGLT